MDPTTKIGPSGWTKNTHKRSPSRRVRAARRALARLEARLAVAAAPGACDSATRELEIQSSRGRLVAARISARLRAEIPSHETGCAAAALRREIAALDARGW